MTEPLKAPSVRPVIQNTKVCVGAVVAAAGIVRLFSPAAADWLAANSEALCTVAGGLFMAYGWVLEKKASK